MTSFITQLLGVVLPVLWFASAKRFADEFRGRTEVNAPGRSALIAATLGTYLAWFGLTASLTGAPPFGGASGFLSLMAFCLLATHVLVERIGGHRLLAVFVATPALLCEIVASALRAGTSHEDVVRRGTLFVVHIVTIAGSSACLLLAGGCGILYLLLERAMRQQSFGLLFKRLPDLAELGKNLRGTARVGFVLMTVGYNLGIWLAHDEKTSGFRYTDPTVLLTIGVWILFGLIALPARVRLLGGRSAARAAAWGLIVIIGIMALSAIPGISFHRFKS